MTSTNTRTLVTSSLAELAAARPDPAAPTAIAIGNFDGVHLGHQRVLGHVAQTAKQDKLDAVIVTFDPPSKVLFLGQKYLTSRHEKLKLLAAYGFSATVVIPFTREYAQTDKQVFIAELAQLKPAHIIVGEDFRFGHKREGRLEDLSHITGHLEVIGMQHLEDEPIKSSHIRKLLEAGDVPAAQKFLGRSYEATATVVEGDKRGRTIGYPTANLNLPPEKALPKGVFAVRVKVPQGMFTGMANVGTRPSFETDPPSLEAHLFNFDDDLYGAEMTVSFEHYLRGQKAFSGLDELKAQLAADAEAAKLSLIND